MCHEFLWDILWYEQATYSVQSPHNIFRYACTVHKNIIVRPQLGSARWYVAIWDRASIVGHGLRSSDCTHVIYLNGKLSSAKTIILLTQWQNCDGTIYNIRHKLQNSVKMLALIQQCWDGNYPGICRPWIAGQIGLGHNRLISLIFHVVPHGNITNSTFPSIIHHPDMEMYHWSITITQFRHRRSWSKCAERVPHHKHFKITAHHHLLKDNEEQGKDTGVVHLTCIPSSNIKFISSGIV